MPVLVAPALATASHGSLPAVRSSADSLLALLNQILDFSKIEAGRLELDPVPFCLRARVGGALRGLVARAEAKNLPLVVDMAPNIPDAVVGDAGRLAQVLVSWRR